METIINDGKGPHLLFNALRDFLEEVKKNLPDLYEKYVSFISGNFIVKVDFRTDPKIISLFKTLYPNGYNKGDIHVIVRWVDEKKYPSWCYFVDMHGHESLKSSLRKNSKYI